MLIRCKACWVAADKLNAVGRCVIKLSTVICPRLRIKPTTRYNTSRSVKMPTSSPLSPVTKTQPTFFPFSFNSSRRGLHHLLLTLTLFYLWSCSLRQSRHGTRFQLLCPSLCTWRRVGRIDGSLLTHRDFLLLNGFVFSSFALFNSTDHDLHIGPAEKKSICPNATDTSSTSHRFPLLTPWLLDLKKSKA